MNEQEHISYSAADIERYHKGLMTTTEMHALEKAALDDPFLADAIEGYIAAPVNTANDLDLLRKKLEERVSKEEKGEIITLQKFAWLRVAALFIIIAGAAFITYRYALRTEKTAVAKTETVQHKADTTHQPAAIENNAATETDKQQEIVKPDASEQEADALTSAKEKTPQSKPELAKDAEAKKDIVAAPTQSVSVPAKEVEEINRAEVPKQQNTVEAKKSVAKQRSKTDADGVNDAAQSDKKDNALNEVVVSGYTAQNNKANIFRGQVQDANNMPLPFANVTNTRDNIGTYTDVKGNFVLTSPDSTLDVQVRSIGFENNIVRLQNNLANNAVVMQQDTQSITSTIVKSDKVITRRQKVNNIVLEEPEPEDGWYNYDTYLANNIQLPDEIKTKNPSPGEVELSFDVNKNGEPVNIKVEKSACKKCDAEAIRLLKDGPKWKKKKNKRAKIAVAF